MVALFRSVGKNRHTRLGYPGSYQAKPNLISAPKELFATTQHERMNQQMIFINELVGHEHIH